MGNYTMPLKKRGHGAKGYWIEGEGYYGLDGDVPQADAKSMPQSERSESHMKFCRMFDLQKFQPSREALEALGQTMADLSRIDTATDTPPDSSIPAGFTYFGQFVDHDISRTSSTVELGESGVANITNERTPSLDLDSLYGEGPDTESFYQSDGVRFKIGVADATDFGAAPELPNDLPRKPVSGQVAQAADIGDHRNDENLAVAQTHLAFLKFHNKVVDDVSTPNSFDEVRKIVRQHYQSILLSDFLPRIVDPEIYGRVMKEGRRWYYPDKFDPSTLCMPIEFSVAAYRLGHTMVRNTYEWNRVFRTGGSPAGVATLVNLFQFSELSGNFTPQSPEGDGAPRLPANWVANWLLLHDFSEIVGVDSDPDMNFARPLNTVLAEKLSDLEEFRSIPEAVLKHLAVRNLLRGSQLGLPSGQTIANAIGAAPLVSDQLSSGPHHDLLVQHGFDLQTPLWYYILKEAEVMHDGQHLGEVGSVITMETFHGLLEASKDSILLEDDWTPSLVSANPGHYTMADMLAYVDELNPLAIPA